MYLHTQVFFFSSSAFKNVSSGYQTRALMFVKHYPDGAISLVYPNLSCSPFGDPLSSQTISAIPGCPRPECLFLHCSYHRTLGHFCRSTIRAYCSPRLVDDTAEREAPWTHLLVILETVRLSLSVDSGRIRSLWA